MEDASIDEWNPWIYWSSSKGTHRWVEQYSTGICHASDRIYSVGFLYATISETFPTTAINTHSSVAKFQIKLGFIRKQNVLPSRRSGRPRETTLRQDRHITLIHLRNRWKKHVTDYQGPPHVTSENDQLAYENTNIRFMMNLLFTHCIYIEITTLSDTYISYIFIVIFRKGDIQVIVVCQYKV
jgi:hypothetical protein